MGPPARPVERAEPAGELRPGASGVSADTGRAAAKTANARQGRPAPAGSQQGRGQLPSPPRPPPRPQLSAGGSSAGGAGTAVSPPAGVRSLLTGSAGGHGWPSLASGTSTLGSKGARDLLRPAKMLFNTETAAGFRSGFVVTPIGHLVALPFEQLKPGASSALSSTSPAAQSVDIRHVARFQSWTEARTPYQHPHLSHHAWRRHLKSSVIRTGVVATELSMCSCMQGKNRRSTRLTCTWSTARSGLSTTCRA